LRWRIAALQLNQGAAVEISRRGNPRPSLAPPASLLFERDQPIAFDRAWLGNDVGVGRAGPLDDADAAQKIDPAALLVIAPSGPISK
jgi:hypothetical protein